MIPYTAVRKYMFLWALYSHRTVDLKWNNDYEVKVLTFTFEQCFRDTNIVWIVYAFPPDIGQSSRAVILDIQTSQSRSFSHTLKCSRLIKSVILPKWYWWTDIVFHCWRSKPSKTKKWRQLQSLFTGVREYCCICEKKIYKAFLINCLKCWLWLKTTPLKIKLEGRGLRLHLTHLNLWPNCLFWQERRVHGIKKAIYLHQFWY